MISTFLFLLLAHSVYSQTESTGFMCSGSSMILSCPRSNNLFVFLKSEDRVNRDECQSNEPSTNSQCATSRLSDSIIQQACPFDFTKSGETSCKFVLPANSYSRDSANCSQFIANYRNIHYKCLPTPDAQIRPDIKYYDICGSGDVVSKASSGFIQTPGYPEYYGNNRDCGVTFRAAQPGEKLYIYLIRLSIENNLNNDYVAVYNQTGNRLGLVTGFRSYPSLIHASGTNERIRLNFKSDWITSVALSRPKGMLVYFEYLNDPIPTEEPTTVTSTTEPTSSTTSSTTAESSTESTTTSSSTETTSSSSDATTTNTESTSEATTTPLSSSVEPETTTTEEPESSKIVEPSQSIKRQTIYIITSGLFALLAVLVVIAALIAHKKRKVYDLFRINYKKAPITNSGNSTDENDIIQTILVEDTDEMGSVKSDEPARENYFNQKLRKLYQEMDKTMQLSKSILSRRSTLLSSRSNDPASTLPRSDVESGVALPAAAATTSSGVRIYKGESPLDTSDSTHHFSEQEENECGIKYNDHEDDSSSPNTSSSN